MHVSVSIKFMGMHDWSRVEDGVFHHFHHAWIEELTRALNGGILPSDHYAMAEQHAAGFGPDVLTLLESNDIEHLVPDAEEHDGWTKEVLDQGGTVQLSVPSAPMVAQTDREHYRRRQKNVVVRHASGDRLVAVVEVISRGNKSGRHAVQALLEKAGTLMERGVHLSLVDVHRPGKFDPTGIHGEIWEYLTAQVYTPPEGKSLTAAAYESSVGITCFVYPFGIGDRLNDLPLYIGPGKHVLLPLHETYERAFAALPRRWKRVLC